jgi:hypothetical protein
MKCFHLLSLPASAIGSLYLNINPSPPTRLVSCWQVYPLSLSLSVSLFLSISLSALYLSLLSLSLLCLCSLSLSLCLSLSLSLSVSVSLSALSLLSVSVSALCLCLCLSVSHTTSLLVTSFSPGISPHSLRALSSPSSHGCSSITASLRISNFQSLHVHPLFSPLHLLLPSPYATHLPLCLSCHRSSQLS